MLILGGAVCSALALYDELRQLHQDAAGGFGADAGDALEESYVLGGDYLGEGLGAEGGADRLGDLGADAVDLQQRIKHPLFVQLRKAEEQIGVLSEDLGDVEADFVPLFEVGGGVEGDLDLVDDASDIEVDVGGLFVFDGSFDTDDHCTPLSVMV